MKYLLFFLVFVALISPSFVGAYLWRDLSLGDSGEDVRWLQQKLNKSGFLVAGTGPGSPGNETNFFGNLTRNAVVRYQEFFAGNILAPFGLTNGTGLVDERTRKHLLGQTNRQEERSGTTPEIESGVLRQNNSISSKPSLLSLSPSSGGFGTMVTIRGDNFSMSGNDIFAGNRVIKGAPSSDGKTLTFEVINTFGVDFSQSGVEYMTIPLWIYVENENGLSEDLQFDLILK